MNKKIRVTLLIAAFLVVTSIPAFFFISSKNKEKAAEKSFNDYTKDILKVESISIKEDDPFFSLNSDANTMYKDLGNKIKGKIKIEVIGKQKEKTSTKLNVEITTVDFKSLFLDTYNEVKNKSADDNTEEGLYKKINSLIASDRIKMKKNNISINVTEKGGKYIVENQKELDNAIYGGLGEAIEEIQSDYIKTLKDNIVKK